MFKPGNADVVRTGDLAAAQTAASQAQTASSAAAAAVTAATAQRVLAETAAGQAQASASAASASQAGAAAAVAAAFAGRTLTAGTGITGGGNLASDRTFSFDQSWGDARYAALGGSEAVSFSCGPATLGVHALSRDAGDNRYALLSGGAFTGQVSVNTPAGTGALYGANTGLIARWAWGRNGAAESGSNAGSNWALFRYSDAGSLLGAPIAISRATGAVTFEVAPSVGANAVWHAGNFNPAAYAPLAGATFTGGVSLNGNFGTWTTAGWGVGARLQAPHALQLNTSGGVTYGIVQSGDSFFVIRGSDNTAGASVTYPLIVGPGGGSINGSTIWTAANLNPSIYFQSASAWWDVGSTVWAFASGSNVGIGASKPGSELLVGASVPGGTWIHVGNTQNWTAAGAANQPSMWRRIA